MIWVRLGQDQGFAEVEKAMIAVKSGTIKIVSGAPVGAHMPIEPMDALKTLDIAALVAGFISDDGGRREAAGGKKRR